MTTPTKTRPYHVALLVLFVIIIAGVPISQAIIDKVVEEEEKPLALTLFEKAPSEEHLRDYEKLLEDNSYYEQKMRPMFQLARYRLVREMGEKALPGTDGWYFYTPGLRYLVEPYFRDLREKPKDDPVATIKDFARQLRSRGIELLVVPIPGKASIYPDKLVEGLKPSAKLSAHTLEFIEELKRSGINTLALHQLLWQRRAVAPKEQLYMKADTHWTGDGVKLVSAHLAKWVKGRPWYRQAKPRYKRERMIVDRPGDVPEMTKIPEREALFGSEKVVAYKVSNIDGGEPYEDPEEPNEAPVLLLGDSFSRVFQTDDPESAGLIANLAYELQLPLSSIVNDGGASTLVRQALARDLDLLKGKHLIIWSFVERDIRFGRQGWQKFALK